MTQTPLTSPPLTSPAADAPRATRPTRREQTPFTFIGERLWLDFVNTDDVRRGVRFDALRDFDTFVQWLEAASVIDTERSTGLRRRAQQQPAGAAAALVDARRVRAALRALAARGNAAEKTRIDTLAEINRILGRSAGTRRLEPNEDGTFTRSFVPVGDAFAGLIIPVVESAADALVIGELARIRRCADARCPRVFFDGTKNGRRRWCDMATCGNRAKAARHRTRMRRNGDGAQNGDAGQNGPAGPAAPENRARETRVAATDSPIAPPPPARELR